MPFAQPTLSAASGARQGVTTLLGSLGPIISSGFETRIGADIGAFPLLGVIGTTVSAGFNAGTPPRGASMLVVTVAGAATTSRASIVTAGGYCRAHAELSITIEEWVEPALILPRRGAPTPPPKLMNRVTFNPTKIFDDWGAVLSYQLRIDDGTPFVSVAGMPVSPLKPIWSNSFVCWVNLVQSAECEAVSGFAEAVSNVQYDFPPPFFAFL